MKRILFALVIAGLGIVLFASCRSIDYAGQARNEALSYGKGLGLQVVNAECSNRDSDGDDYVSCTLAQKDGDKTALLPLECSYWIGSGCKVALPKTVHKHY